MALFESFLEHGQKGFPSTCFIFNWLIGSVLKKKHQYLTLYRNWNRTPVYFELAVSDITSTHSLNGSWLGLGLNHGSPSPHPLYNDSRQLEWSVPHMIELSRNCKLNIDETRLTFNCAHLKSTKESLTVEGGTGWFLVILGHYGAVLVGTMW